ncbi:cellular nucleic acid-binding protein, partial [Trifolium medium]|nr:cellular nucleic acid-binding protein [Trifolium medium]
MNDNKRKGQDRAKPYGDKNKKGGESSGGRKKIGGNCFKCGEVGHRFFEWPMKGEKCFRCGKLGHKADVCREGVVCFNCGEEGHKSPECKKPKRMIGKVFALSGEG